MGTEVGHRGAPRLDAKVGLRVWTQRLDTEVGCRDDVGHRGWMQRLDAKDGQRGWTQRLDT